MFITDGSISTPQTGSETMKITVDGHMLLGTIANVPELPIAWNNVVGSKLFQVKATSSGQDSGISFLGTNAGSPRGGTLWYDSSLTKVYFDSRYDNTAGVIEMRVRTNSSTPITALTLKDTMVNVSRNLNVDYNLTMKNIPTGATGTDTDYLCINTTSGLVFRNETGC